MKKKTLLPVVFIALCFVMCLVPFVCMSFAPTNETLENRRLAEFPELVTDDGFNYRFMTQLGEYFEDHFALRKYLVAADAQIISLFGDSSVDTVVKGTNGWLYYSASADDYAGINTFSDRKAFNAAHNIALMQKYAESRGARFVFTCAPNKNSLYPENMPYFYPSSGNAGNIEKAVPYLKEEGVNYTDLFGLFTSQDEVLYLKRDSHWNNKGALLAFNALLDGAGKEHDDYSETPFEKVNDEKGDLGKMLYSFLAKPEENYRYDIPQLFTYNTPGQTVEDALVLTSCESAEGSLLMFRDSFGNTLLPLMANAYGSACFSKGTPYALEAFMDAYSPDTVIAEKVERNMSDFAEAPPVFTAPSPAPHKAPECPEEPLFTLKAEESFNSPEYIEFSGEITGADDYGSVILNIDGTEYEAFTVSNESSDFCFLMYLKKEALISGEHIAELMIKTSDGYISLGKQNFIRKEN